MSQTSSCNIKNKVPFFISHDITIVCIRQNQALTVQAIKVQYLGFTHNPFRVCFVCLRGFDHFLGPTLSSVYTAYPLDLSLFCFTVAGVSGDCHLALAFPKLLGSVLATGLSLEL